MWSLWSKSTSDRPPHWANDKGTAFKNPWPSAGAPTWAELLQIKFPLGWYDDLASKHPGTRDVQVQVPDWGVADLKNRGLKREGCIMGTTLGHAGSIAELPLQATAEGGGKSSFWVVYDPIFSARAGPTQHTGPQRMRSSPCQVTDLPGMEFKHSGRVRRLLANIVYVGCDAVMISHNHYDHLDRGTITAISKRFPGARYFVPLGNKSWLCALGIEEDMVHELDWWQNYEHEVQDFGREEAHEEREDTVLRITCVPAQHNSGRGALDQGKTLWCGWVIEQLRLSRSEGGPSTIRRYGAIYHAGDTGYRRTAKSTAICPAYKEIGERFGGFDLSFIPIWRGGSLGFFSNLGLRLSHEDVPSALHASPIDAIDIHKDVKSRNSIAVHFGTFVGSENESLEAIMEFEDGRQSRGVLSLGEHAENEHGHAGILDIGGSLAVEFRVRDIT